MALYSIPTPSGVLADVLAITPNVGYLAVFKDANDALVASHFPSWLVVDYGGSRFLIPVVSQAFNNPSFIFNRYVGYYPESRLPENIPIVTDSFLNPFNPV